MTLCGGAPGQPGPTVFEHVTVHGSATRKTPSYSIVSNRTNEVIGWIRWYGPWMQFWLFAEDPMVWSDVCLRDVMTVIHSLPKGEEAMMTARTDPLGAHCGRAICGGFDREADWRHLASIRSIEIDRLNKRVEDLERHIAHRKDQ